MSINFLSPALLVPTNGTSEIAYVVNVDKTNPITGTALLFPRQLVTDYAVDASSRRLVDSYDWYILPVVNPDGYVYTWTDDRLWRKSRRPNRGSECIGTDLNRNFDFQWMSE